MKKPRLRISDHAVIRHLERVGGFDIEGLRMALARRLEEPVRLGASAVTIDGFTYCVVQDPGGPVIATVLDRNATQAHWSDPSTRRRAR